MLIVHYPESLMMSEGIIEEHSAAAHQGKNVCNTMLYQNIRDNVCYTLLHRNHPFFSYRHPSLTNNAEYFVFLRIFPNFLKIVLRKLRCAYRCYEDSFIRIFRNIFRRYGRKSM